MINHVFISLFSVQTYHILYIQLYITQCYRTNWKIRDFLPTKGSACGFVPLPVHCSNCDILEQSGDVSFETLSMIAGTCLSYLILSYLIFLFDGRIMYVFYFAMRLRFTVDVLPFFSLNHDILIWNRVLTTFFQENDCVGCKLLNNI